MKRAPTEAALLKMSLKPDETDLVGGWVLDGNRVSADPVQSRIRDLIEHSLEKIAVCPETGAWETLYRDPSDGRFWELTYPQSEMHGGGPTRLTNISTANAAAKYRLNSN
jgi:Immunity protein 27